MYFGEFKIRNNSKNKTSTTVMSWCIYSNIDYCIDYFTVYMTITLYMTCITFIWPIILDLSKITLFKDLIGKIIEENGFFSYFPWLWPQLLQTIK